MIRRRAVDDKILMVIRLYVQPLQGLDGTVQNLPKLDLSDRTV